MRENKEYRTRTVPLGDASPQPSDPEGSHPIMGKSGKWVGIKDFATDFINGLCCILLFWGLWLFSHECGHLIVGLALGGQLGSFSFSFDNFGMVILYWAKIPSDMHLTGIGGNLGTTVAAFAMVLIALLFRRTRHKLAAKMAWIYSGGLATFTLVFMVGNYWV